MRQLTQGEATTTQVCLAIKLGKNQLLTEGKAVSRLARTCQDSSTFLVPCNHAEKANCMTE